jgi:hypothetical protein
MKNEPMKFPEIFVERPVEIQVYGENVSDEQRRIGKLVGPLYTDRIYEIMIHSELPNPRLISEKLNNWLHDTLKIRDWGVSLIGPFADRKRSDLNRGSICAGEYMIDGSSTSTGVRGYVWGVFLEPIKPIE